MKKDDRYDSIIKFYAEEAGFNGKDWLRFKAQIRAESNFDPDAISPVGAKGLAQFMDPTWKEWKDGTPGIQEQAGKIGLINPFDPEDAIRSQIAYMKWLLRLVSSWDCAFAAYNWGIGNMLRVIRDPAWLILVPRETRDYVLRIQEFYDQYSREK